MITNISAIEIINIILNLFGLSAILGAVWFLASLNTTVKEIKTNDLPHIEAEIRYLRERLDKKS